MSISLHLSAAEAVVVHEALMSYMNRHRDTSPDVFHLPADSFRGEAAARVLANLDEIAAGIAADDLARSMVPAVPTTDEVKGRWR